MRGAPPAEHKSQAEDAKKKCQEDVARRDCANLISQRLQFLAGLKAHSLSGRDADFLSGARIAANAGFARPDIEHAESAQLDALAFAERVLHGLTDSLDGLLRLGPAHAGFVHHRINYVQLNHSILPLFNGSLC